MVSISIYPDDNPLLSKRFWIELNYIEKPSSSDIIDMIKQSPMRNKDDDGVNRQCNDESDMNRNYVQIIFGVNQATDMKSHLVIVPAPGFWLTEDGLTSVKPFKDKNASVQEQS